MTARLFIALTLALAACGPTSAPATREPRELSEAARAEPPEPQPERGEAESPAPEPPAPELPAPVPQAPRVDEAAREAMRAIRWPPDAQRTVRPRSCVLEEFVIDEESGQLDLESSSEHRFDRAGREERVYWNSDPVGLSGEIRHRYDAHGERVRTDDIPYESIEGGRPPRPPPITYRYVCDGERVEAVAVQRGRTVETQRFRYDAEGRVLEHALERSGEDEGDEGEGDDGESTGERRRVECTYDAAGRPSVRVLHLEQPSRAVRRELVYEGERLVEMRTSIGEAPPDVSSVWALDDGFAVYDGSGIERYRGSCAEIFFKPCSALFAPPPLLHGERAHLPPIELGRPLR